MLSLHNKKKPDRIPDRIPFSKKTVFGSELWLASESVLSFLQKKTRIGSRIGFPSVKNGLWIRITAHQLLHVLVLEGEEKVRVRVPGVGGEQRGAVEVEGGIVDLKKRKLSLNHCKSVQNWLLTTAE